MEFFLPFDIPLLNFLQQHFHNPFTDAFFPFVTYLGELGACWIFLALVFLFMQKYRRAGIFMLAAMVLTTLLGEVLLKNLIGRPRPFTYAEVLWPGSQLLISPPTGYAFPSGHTGASFAAATALFLQHKKEGVLAYIVAFLIGFSRLFLLAHFPSDVLAGAVLGSLLAGAVTLFLQKRLPPEKIQS